MTNVLAVEGLDPRRIMRTYSFAVALLIGVGLLVANLVASPDFGWSDQLAAFSPFALAAMASTPSILSGRGGIDLSVSPLMTFASIVFVAWLAPHGLGGVVSIPIVLLIGFALGALSGLTIVLLRLPPIVVTLCGYFILTGVDLKIAPTPQQLEGSSWVHHLAGSVGPLPGGVVAIAVPALAWLALMRTNFGSLLYAVGGNDSTAFSAGVNVSLIRVLAYGAGGVLAAAGGIVLVGLTSSADSTTATAYTLVAIVAVALGGTSFLGGRGGLVGSIIGAACIYLLQSFLIAIHVSQLWLQVIYSVVLLGAVTLGSIAALDPGKE